MHGAGLKKRSGARTQYFRQVVARSTHTHTRGRGLLLLLFLYDILTPYETLGNNVGGTATFSLSLYDSGI